MRRIILLMSLCALVIGCSKGATPENRVITEKDSFGTLKALLEEYAKSKGGKAPNTAADLSPFEPSYPEPWHMLNNKRIVYAWGVPLGTGNAVLAYSKDVPEKGGTVMLMDGTIAEMSAAEFAAAPKAKK
jgi:hypothetical protein